MITVQLHSTPIIFGFAINKLSYKSQGKDQLLADTWITPKIIMVVYTRYQEARLADWNVVGIENALLGF